MNKTCGSSDRRLSCSLILEQRTRKARSITTVRLWSRDCTTLYHESRVQIYLCITWELSTALVWHFP